MSNNFEINFPVVIFFASIFLLAESIYTMQLTIYPKTAQSKNATSFEYAVVLGIFDAAIALCSPFVATMMDFTKSSPQSVLISSLLMEGASLFVLGYVDKLNNLQIFLGASIILRIIEGAAASAVFTTVFILVSEYFPGSFGIFFLGVLESLVPAGFVLGPLIGTNLYSLGGFSTPFVVVGSLFILFAAVATFLLQIKDNAADPENTNKCGDKEERNISLWKHPAVLTNFIAIFLTSSVITFYFASIEPFLRIEFTTSPSVIGFVFAGSGLLYSAFSVVASLLTVAVGSSGYPFQVAVLLGLTAQAVGNCAIVGIGIDSDFVTVVTGICFLSFGCGLTIFLFFLQAQDMLKDQTRNTVGYGGVVCPPKFKALPIFQKNATRGKLEQNYLRFFQSKFEVDQYGGTRGI
ncbi:Multi-drug resistance efflux pump PmrA [Folsomia candida]|uniref:Multi-drug resistance efflux pump PmrA n=1 Tax=Folsomia candida TaxID=158441 RepID=A0A226CV66_FOLCA|nr:Multi-drug resistance efflux pump PmrA [Folsomia candida]